MVFTNNPAYDKTGLVLASMRMRMHGRQELLPVPIPLGYLLTLFSNDPTTKLPIRSLLISIANPTQLGARSDGIQEGAS